MSLYLLTKNLHRPQTQTQEAAAVPDGDGELESEPEPFEEPVFDLADILDEFKSHGASDEED